MIKRFFRKEEGQVPVEYGLLLALIALVVIGIGLVIANHNGQSNQQHSHYHRQERIVAD